MKRNLILLVSAAVLAVVAGCQKPAPQVVLPAEISIDSGPEITVPVNGYGYSVGLTATVDWELRGYDEKAQSWLVVNPTSGKASSSVQKVAITALGNSGPARSATLTFYGNDDCSASITFTQEAGGGAVSPDAGSTIYSISFLEGMGDFTIEDKDKPSAIDEVWKWSSQYGMVGTGYVSDSGTNYDSESWLVSPLIDLSFEQSAYLTFKHATNFFSNVSVLPDQASVWAREEEGSWAKLDGIYYPDQLGWTFVDAGYADLSEYAGKKMQFAFAYKSTAQKAGTWEVKRVAVRRTAPPAAMTSDKPGAWMEMPAFDGSDSGLYLITHDMEQGGKFVRNYTYCYSPEDRVAVWVAYPLNRSLKGNGSRTDEWGLDPKVPREYQPILYKTYGDGIYDRGHQIPSADRLDEDANISTFYFTNMAPQLSELNQGAIANLENMVRDWSYQMDTLYVVTGSDLQGATKVAHDNEGNEVTVPSGFFKALLGYDASGSVGGDTGGYFGIAFYFDHKDYAGSKSAIMEQSMSIDQLEEKLGYDFFANLPAKIGEEAAAAVESGVDDWWK